MSNPNETIKMGENDPDVSLVQQFQCSCGYTKSKKQKVETHIWKRASDDHKMVMTMVPRTTPVMTTPVKTGKTGKTTPVRTEKAAMSPGKTRKTTPVKRKKTTPLRSPSKSIARNLSYRSPLKVTVKVIC